MRETSVAMNPVTKPVLDPAAFLATAGIGKTPHVYRKDALFNKINQAKYQ